ncbi:putative CASP-like protein PIMP1-like [Capsicum annuum]|nr:putative CASP-like protein PIMP1-like [Capsicum annuum]
MSFKSLLTDPSNRLSSWKGENCCDWKGIKCLSSGHVVVVNLRNPHPNEVMINVNKEVVSDSNESDFALKGTISPLLFTLDHIQYLDLSFNNFMFSKLPVEISNLTKLTYLNLSNSMFQDSITTQFSNLTSLRSLDLSCANLVPDLSSITISLTLPPKLDSGSLLSFISYGYLSSTNLRNENVLTSAIPDILSNLTTLSVIDFSSNDLDGHISYLPQLEKLFVSSNPAITIDLVSMFSVPWSKLTSLDISFTRVGGTVPPSLSNSTSLTIFLADGCSIEGSIPPSITKLKKLRILMLNDNAIAGQLPVSMSGLTSLQYLSLFQNRLQGNIPISICQIPSLEYLNLNWNDLTGRLPSCILQIPKLSYLYVQKNNLNGDIPLSLFRKSRLDQISFGVS